MRKQDSIRRARVGTKVGAWSLCATFVVGLAACGGSSNQCHYMALASSLIGQTTYAGNAVNAGVAVSGATLAGPLGGLVEDPGATVAYVADTANNRVLAYTSVPVPATGATAAFALGQGSLSTTTTGIGARSDSPFGLSGPSKVTVSDDGRLVVTDTGNNRVLIWNTLPKSTNVAPDIVIGQVDLNSRLSNRGAVKPSASSLSNPTSAILASNQLVVVDQNNNRVLIYDATPGTLATGAAASVELGQIDDGAGSGFTTNTAGFFISQTSTQSAGIQFTTPTDAWTNGSVLVVSDTGNNRVLYWSQVPVVNFTNATGVVGQTSGFSTTNPGVSATLVNNPIGVFVSGGALFVADSGNNRVLEYSSGWASTQKGYPATYVFGQQDFSHSSYNDDDQNGTPGDQQNNQSNTNATQNTLHGPSGVFADNNGNLWVSDRTNNRVLAFAANQQIDGSNTDGNGGVPNCNGYNPISPN